MMWLSLTKRNGPTFRVTEIIPSFDTVTVAYIHNVSKLLMDCSASLDVSHVKTIKKKNNRNICQTL